MPGIMSEGSVDGLFPAVQDAKETDIRAEMPGIACHLQHGFGAG